MKTPQLIQLSQVGQVDLGYITVAQNSNLPFQIKRVYWTYYTPNKVTRGHHAHKALHQIIVPVSGFFDFHLEDTEGNTYDFRLDDPSIGLYIPPMHWRTIQFSHNAVLLCLASEEYAVEDYIRDYDEFKQMKIK